MYSRIMWNSLVNFGGEKCWSKRLNLCRACFFYDHCIVYICMRQDERCTFSNLVCKWFLISMSCFRPLSASDGNFFAISNALAKSFATIAFESCSCSSEKIKHSFDFVCAILPLILFNLRQQNYLHLIIDER